MKRFLEYVFDFSKVYCLVMLGVTAVYFGFAAVCWLVQETMG